MSMLKFQNIVLRVSKVTSQAVRTLSKSLAQRPEPQR